MVAIAYNGYGYGKLFYEFETLKKINMNTREEVNKILNSLGEVQPNGAVIYDDSEMTEIEERLVKLFTIPNVLVRFANYLSKTGTYVHDDIEDFLEQDV